MTGLIILAAGNSSRLGQPKQNLVFENQTLLHRAIETGENSNCEPIILILGANAELINVPNHHKLTIIYNNTWQEGVASSIRLGVTELENNDLIEQVIIMLCDQPFVTAVLINSLIAVQLETRKEIVASLYHDVPGVPALFGRSLFPELRSLKGQQGAKQLLLKHPENVAKVPFQKGMIDIDTKDDYEQLINSVQRISHSKSKN